MAVRVGNHTGKKGVKGVWNPYHNDRLKMKEKEWSKKHGQDETEVEQDYVADHIDLERTKNNLYWTPMRGWQTDEEHGRTGSLHDQELEQYEALYGDALKQVNNNYEKSRHYNKMKKMKDWVFEDSKKCPSEVILYLGDKDAWERGDMNLETFKEYVDSYIRFMNDDPQNKYVRVLDVTIHLDEQGAPHAHVKRTMMAHDKHGNLTPNQEKALEEAGFAPSGKRGKTHVSRYFNRLNTFTAFEREVCITIAQQLGVEVIKEPDRSHGGLELADYQVQKAKERLKGLNLQNEKIVNVIVQNKEANKKIVASANQAKAERDEAKRKAIQIMKDTKAEQDKMIEEATAKVDEINSQVLEDASRQKLLKRDVIEVDRAVWKQVSNQLQTLQQEKLDASEQQQQADDKTSQANAEMEKANIIKNEYSAKSKNLDQIIEQKVSERTTALQDEVNRLRPFERMYDQVKKQLDAAIHFIAKLKTVVFRQQQTGFDDLLQKDLYDNSDLDGNEIESFKRCVNETCDDVREELGIDDELSR